METKYFVARAYRYAESGNWEYNLVGMYADLTAAKQAYHDALAKINKPSNDFDMAILYDSYGNKIMSDFDNKYVAPEPNEE